MMNHNSTATKFTTSKIFAPDQRYQKIRELGEGGMGRVYLVYDRELKREVALKTVLLSDDPQLVQRFIREAEALAALTHPNIVAIYDIKNAADCCYFTMDYVKGENLRQYLRTKALPLSQTVQIMQAVAVAIDYVHQQGIIHRDVKPANIMLTPEGVPVVMDFGLVMVATEDAKISKTGEAVGTPAYMSLEQALGKREEIDERSDVYSLGAVLYELLTGQAPFCGAFHEVIAQISSKEVTPPRQVIDAIPVEVENICLKALAKDKVYRYQSASELAGDLQRFIEGKPVVAMPPGLRYRLKKWVIANKLLAGLSIAVSLAVLAIVVWSYGKVTIAAYQAKAALDKAKQERQRAREAQTETVWALVRSEAAQQNIEKALQQVRSELAIATQASAEAQRILAETRQQEARVQQEREKIRQIQDKILQTRIATAQSKEAKIRIEGVRALGVLAREMPAAIAPLMVAIKDEDAEIRGVAAQSLAQSPKTMALEIVKQFFSLDPQSKIQIVEELANKKATALPLLKVLKTYTDSVVSKKIEAAIAQIEKQ